MTKSDLAVARRHLRLADVEQIVEQIVAMVFDQIAPARAGPLHEPEVKEQIGDQASEKRRSSRRTRDL
jgi:hypothetical protein